MNIVENSPQLKGEQITKFYDNLHIALSPTFVLHPLTNRQTKTTNKKILASIKKGWMTLKDYRRKNFDHPLGDKDDHALGH